MFHYHPLSSTTTLVHFTHCLPRTPQSIRIWLPLSLPSPCSLKCLSKQTSDLLVAKFRGFFLILILLDLWSTWHGWLLLPFLKFSLPLASIIMPFCSRSRPNPLTSLLSVYYPSNNNVPSGLQPFSSLLSLLPSILRLQYSLLIPRIYIFSSNLSPDFQTKISSYPQ